MLLFFKDVGKAKKCRKEQKEHKNARHLPQFLDKEDGLLSTVNTAVLYLTMEMLPREAHFSAELEKLLTK